MVTGIRGTAIVAFIAATICVLVFLRCAVPSPSDTVQVPPPEGGANSGSDASAAVLIPASCASCASGWCRLEPGTFTMGAAPDELTRAAFSEDQVVVTLTHPFEMSQYETTVAEWTDLGLPLSSLQPKDCATAKCPVNAIWYDAMRFANLRSQKHVPSLPPCYVLTGCEAEAAAGIVCTNATETGPLYECPGYRIATEAEWEYACRAGTTTAFYDGAFTPSAVPPGRNIALNCYDEPTLDPIGWYCTNSQFTAHPVGGKWPNPWCLYDMSGNMAEWTSGGYNGQPYGTSPQTDPGSNLGTFTSRVHRGGEYTRPPGDASCFSRVGTLPQFPDPGIGIRLVRTLDLGAPD